MSERERREPNNLDDYDIQVAAEITAGTHWVWTRENLQLEDDDLHKKETVELAEKMIKERRVNWENFTKDMNA